MRHFQPISHAFGECVFMIDNVILRLMSFVSLYIVDYLSYSVDPCADDCDIYWRTPYEDVTEECVEEFEDSLIVDDDEDDLNVLLESDDDIDIDDDDSEDDG